MLLKFCLPAIADTEAEIRFTDRSAPGTAEDTGCCSLQYGGLLAQNEEFVDVASKLLKHLR
jgi:hypothetical protein